MSFAIGSAWKKLLASAPIPGGHAGEPALIRNLGVKMPRDGFKRQGHLLHLYKPEGGHPVGTINIRLQQQLRDVSLGHYKPAGLRGQVLPPVDARAVDLRNFDLRGTRFAPRSNLQYTDLRGADVTGAVFDHVQFSRALLPDLSKAQSIEGSTIKTLGGRDVALRDKANRPGQLAGAVAQKLGTDLTTFRNWVGHVPGYTSVDYPRIMTLKGIKELNDPSLLRTVREMLESGRSLDDVGRYLQQVRQTPPV